MRCPPRSVAFTATSRSVPLGCDPDGRWEVGATRCQRSEGERFIVHPNAAGSAAAATQARSPAAPRASSSDRRRAAGLRPLLKPRHTTPRTPAGRALSCPTAPRPSGRRRCHQALSRDGARVKPGDLRRVIQQATDGGSPPARSADVTDAVRNLGNLVAHSHTSTASGELVPVEPGEAGGRLDVLEALFNSSVVQPGGGQAAAGGLERRAPERRQGADDRRPMRDPHVQTLQYQVQPAEGVQFGDPPPVAWETPEFRARLKGGSLSVSLLRHYATEDVAQPAVEPYAASLGDHGQFGHRPARLWAGVPARNRHRPGGGGRHRGSAEGDRAGPGSTTTSPVRPLSGLPGPPSRSRSRRTWRACGGDGPAT